MPSAIQGEVSWRARDRPVDCEVHVRNILDAEGSVFFCFFCFLLLQCTDFVKEYGPDLIPLIANLINPDKDCQVSTVRIACV